MTSTDTPDTTAQTPPVDRAALRDRIAAAIKSVRIRPKLDPVTTSMVQAGAGFHLTDEEAGPVADAVLAVLPACSDPIECSHEAALGQAQQDVRRLGLMVDEYGAGASALTGKLKRLRDIGHRLAAHAVGFQDVLDDSDRGPWARTVGADIAALREVLDAPATPVLPAPADRAAILREAADSLDESEALRDLTDDHMHDVHAAANELRRMATEGVQR